MSFIIKLAMKFVAEPAESMKPIVASDMVIVIREIGSRKELVS